MADPEVDAVKKSLDAAWKELHDWLIFAYGYVEDQANAGDERAQWLHRRITAAFNAMEAESINAAGILEDRENRD